MAFFDKYLLKSNPLTPLQTINISKRAPGSRSGGSYIWDDVARSITVPDSGRCIIKITASVEEGALWSIINQIDLNVLDGDLGKSSLVFRGSTLKGLEKELYLLIDLKSFQDQSLRSKLHNIWSQFWGGKELELSFNAQKKPFLKSIEILPWDDANFISFDFFWQPNENSVSRGGLPLKSFVALGRKIETVDVRFRCMSAKMRHSSDDDGLKIVVNDVITPHVPPTTSSKYRNWIGS